MSETSELFKTIFITVEKKMREVKRIIVKDCKNSVAKVKDIAEDKVRLLKSCHCQGDNSVLVRPKNRVEEEKQAEKRAAVAEEEIVEETVVEPVVEDSEVSLSPSAEVSLSPSAQELRTNLANQAENDDVPELSPSEINNNRNKQKLTVPEIYDEVINSIKTEPENNKIFIFHGRGKTKIDNVVRLLKKDGLKVKKFTGVENDTAVDMKHTEDETLTDQMKTFANSLKNEVGIFYLDARAGYGALNVNQVLNNNKNIIMLILTDDEVFTEELKEYNFFEYSF